MSICCYLGLGSNLASPERQLKNAIEAVRALPYTVVCDVASFYVSKAWGRKSLPDYLNTVIKLQTSLKPLQLLSYCHEVEQKQGRVRKILWGARTIDIDILLFGTLKINSKKLTIPHPRIEQRDFVYIPLMEISAYTSINFNGRS